MGGSQSELYGPMANPVGDVAYLRNFPSWSRFRQVQWSPKAVSVRNCAVLQPRFTYYRSIWVGNVSAYLLGERGSILGTSGSVLAS